MTSLFLIIININKIRRNTGVARLFDKRTGIYKSIINGKTYCITSFIEAAAGSLHGEYTYIAASGAGTKKTNFTLRWPNCGVYGGPGDTEYDQCQTEQTTFFGNLDAIVDSLM